MQFVVALMVYSGFMFSGLFRDTLHCVVSSVVIISVDFPKSVHFFLLSFCLFLYKFQYPFIPFNTTIMQCSKSD